MQPQQTWCLSHTAYKRHVERALLNTIEEALRKYHSKGFLGGTQRLRSSLKNAVTNGHHGLCHVTLQSKLLVHFSS